MKKTAFAVVFLFVTTLCPFDSNAWTFGPMTGWMHHPSIVITPQPLVVLDDPSLHDDDDEDDESSSSLSFNQKHKTSSSPRYEITDDHEQFQIAVDVSGCKAEDICVSVDDIGRILSVNGRVLQQQKKTNKKKSFEGGVGGTYQFSKTFSQRFPLDPTIQVDKLRAQLKNGVLIISAPKEIKGFEELIFAATTYEEEESDLDAA